MDQDQFTSTFCARPQQFAWFLGAGASAAAGLPTATDIIWELKRRYYCRQENQDISRQDLQLSEVKDRIQSYMVSRGFPNQDAPDEYTKCFELVFGGDRELQRRYIAESLAEKKATLSVGNRVLGALLALGKTRIIFTTNFDSIVEKAFAEISGRSLAPFHLEGAYSANKAVNNEEYPVYCKLHGDFRHDSIKNLKSDLVKQNQELSNCLLNTASRFGFIIAGYSGRDNSIIELFQSVLKNPNPFPHGLYWATLKHIKVSAAVQTLIDDANRIGVDAAIINIETFDSLMLRLWRNIPDKDATIDSKVRKLQHSKVNIPLPPTGSGAIVRMNAVPIAELPSKCFSLEFKNSKEWADLHLAARNTEGALIFTKTDKVLCWGSEQLIRREFRDVISIIPYDLSPKLAELKQHLNVKGFLEEALCRALVKGKPLIIRATKRASFLIADAHTRDLSMFGTMNGIVRKPFGEVTGLFAPVDDGHPEPVKIFWAECIRTSINIINGRPFLLLDPDIWIWPARARKVATTFLEERRSGRYNKTYNTLIDAWLELLLGKRGDIREIVVSTGNGGAAADANFKIGLRTAFTRRLAS